MANVFFFTAFLGALSDEIPYSESVQVLRQQVFTDFGPPTQPLCQHYQQKPSTPTPNP